MSMLIGKTFFLVWVFSAILCSIFDFYRQHPYALAQQFYAVLDIDDLFASLGIDNFQISTSVRCSRTGNNGW